MSQLPVNWKELTPWEQLQYIGRTLPTADFARAFGLEREDVPSSHEVQRDYDEESQQNNGAGLQRQHDERKL